MRRTPLLHLVQISAAALLAGCNLLNLDPSEKTKPATEETVKGTWRNAEPDAEGKTVRMTLRIDADHKMVWSRRISGIREDGSDAEYQRENFRALSGFPNVTCNLPGTFETVDSQPGNVGKS